MGGLIVTPWRRRFSGEHSLCESVEVLFCCAVSCRCAGFWADAAANLLIPRGVGGLSIRVFFWRIR